MTTYADFQTYYTRKMWRVGDADWVTDLPTLITKAEARINRDLRFQDLMTSATLSAVTTDIVALPGDVRELATVQLVGTEFDPAEALSAAAYKRHKRVFDASPTDRQRGSVFAVIGTNLHLLMNASVTETYDIDLDYYLGIVAYSTSPASPFYDIHPDFYEAALNVQAYEYLKDFELSNEYNSQYLGLLEDMRRESEYKLYPPGQIKVELPGHVM